MARWVSILQRLRNRIEQLKQTIADKAANAPAETIRGQRPATMFDLTLAEMDQRAATMQEELVGVTEDIDELTLSIQATASNGSPMSQSPDAVVGAATDGALPNILPQPVAPTSSDHTGTGIALNEIQHSTANHGHHGVLLGLVS